MDDAFNFFASSKDDLPLTKFDFDQFNESDSGFLSDFATPDKSLNEKENSASKNKIVTFKEPPEKLLKKNHEEPKIGNIITLADKSKPAIDSTEHQKAGSENDDSKASVVAASVSVLGQFDSEVSIENYFKNLLQEVSGEICQKALKKLVEIEQFERACPHILDDLLKEAKKLEGKLLKEKMALKKRVERLMNAFNV